MYGPPRFKRSQVVMLIIDCLFLGGWLDLVVLKYSASVNRKYSSIILSYTHMLTVGIGRLHFS